MTDEEIFDLADQYGWQDDFGRWNFRDDGLIGFALALLKAENVSVNAPSSQDLPETERPCMSEKHGDFLTKDQHEFFCPRCGHCCRDGLERLIRIMGTFDLATGHADTMDQALDALESELRDVLGHLRARREWVGLTDEEIKALPSWWPSYDQMPALMTLARDIENSLKEKNNVLR